MKLKKAVFTSTTILCLLSAMFLIGFGIPEKASPDVIYVPTDYSTIQEAINHANYGDTIFVYNGTYYENVVVNKSVSLIGEDRDLTIIDGGASGRVISITANNVNINGFTIQKSGKVNDGGIFVDHSSNNNISCNTITNNGIGIGLYYSSNNVVSGNTLSDNNYGIWLDYSSSNTLFDNNMSGNTYNFCVYGDADSHFDNSVDVSNTVDAKPVYYLKGVTNTVYDAQTNAGTFYLINCNNITVKDLTLVKNEHGVFLWYTTNSKIENVTTSDNNYGIYLYYSSSNFVSGNNALDNNYGICFESSNNNVVVGNNASSNNEDGIKISYSRDNAVSGNTVSSNNEHGIYLYHQSDNNTVSGNTVSSNGIYGIYLSHSSNNTVSGNTVSSNNYEGIYLSRSSSNVVVGNTASNNWDGICISYQSDNNVVSGNTVSSNNYEGIGLYHSSNDNLVVGNTASSNNKDGIKISYCSNNVVFGNTVSSNNNYGIWLYISSNNVVSGSTVSDNNYGIGLYYSSNNTIYHNNFINNTGQVSPGSIDVWDDGYEGNYWSDYTGIDSEGDGIGDMPYVFDVDNQDNYPLMGIFSDFNVTSEYHATVICNSTISNFKFDHIDKAIKFNVTGKDGTTGFCRICIPTALMDTYTVFVNGTEIPYTLLPRSNSTKSYLYFAYEHSTREVIIMPTILSDYYELLERYLQLLADFNSLNSTHSNLASDYDNLQTSYTQLQGQHNLLNSSYNSLQAYYSELQSGQKAIIDEMSNIRNYIYVFMAITVFIAATVYLAIKTKVFKGKP
jgi:parallel beta-helix repeat protein